MNHWHGSIPIGWSFDRAFNEASFLRVFTRILK
ncbi:hypothetical protein PQC43_gp129 [Escherichia phage vB_EcoP-101114UKE3]|uniref:Uncharacterized protein n=1 Tax=Escherichia phage vB_EcoP-101114UKE3 TaxID=2865794 RepID=A0AAE7XSZ7_9CAUD|nr:hypothetical protein PQC43_gp129 [Escherichia phage vB_EcoP-101114UKE3]QZI79255.1 hypothetical protein 101114UKE3_124 [Escherichia phage vB_EcoP-101114UKE3]USM81228.1 hypothetical protein 101114BS3_101 [Escherichia phage vB_EcoP-101114BS3]